MLIQRSFPQARSKTSTSALDGQSSVFGLHVFAPKLRRSPVTVRATSRTLDQMELSGVIAYMHAALVSGGPSLAFVITGLVINQGARVVAHYPGLPLSGKLSLGVGARAGNCALMHHPCSKPFSCPGSTPPLRASLLSTHTPSLASGDAMEDIIDVLARRALRAVAALPAGKPRVVVGIAGPAGSGKTTLARAVVSRANQLTHIASLSELSSTPATAPVSRLHAPGLSDDNRKSIFDHQHDSRSAQDVAVHVSLEGFHYSEIALEAWPERKVHGPSWTSHRA